MLPYKVMSAQDSVVAGRRWQWSGREGYYFSFGIMSPDERHKHTPKVYYRMLKGQITINLGDNDTNCPARM